MNSYATASVDSKDSIACLQSYHRGGFVDYGRLYPPTQSSAAAVYLDQYRLQQSTYPASVGEHAAAGPYSVAIGGKTTAGAGYDQATVGYGFFDLQETFRRDQWSLLGSAVQDGAGGGLKRLDSSGGDKTAVTRSCPGGSGGDAERPTAAVQGVGGSGISDLVDSVQIKCEDGARPTHRPQISHHHHQQQQQHASSRAVVPGCSPTKHHHSKHASDSIKSSKGINISVQTCESKKSPEVFWHFSQTVEHF